MNLGGVRFALGEHDEAIRLFNLGLQISPSNFMLLFSLGSAYAAVGRKARGASYCRPSLSRRAALARLLRLSCVRVRSCFLTRHLTRLVCGLPRLAPCSARTRRRRRCRASRL